MDHPADILERTIAMQMFITDALLSFTSSQIDLSDDAMRGVYEFNSIIEGNLKEIRTGIEKMMDNEPLDP